MRKLMFLLVLALAACGKGPQVHLTGGDAPKSSARLAGDLPDDGEKDLCARTLGLEPKRLKVAGNKPNVSVESDEPIAVRVTGNQSTVKLRLHADAGADPLVGLCVFVAGNEGSFEVSVDANVDKIVVVERGNQARVRIAVRKDVKVETLVVNLNGNDPELVVEGEGKIPCPTQTGVTCNLK